MAVAGEIHVTLGTIGFAQDGANIFEIEVAAIAKCPIRLREIGIRELRIDIGMRRLPKQLRDRKRVRLESKTHG